MELSTMLTGKQHRKNRIDHKTAMNLRRRIKADTFRMSVFGSVLLDTELELYDSKSILYISLLMARQHDKMSEYRWYKKLLKPEVCKQMQADLMELFKTSGYATEAELVESFKTMKLKDFQTKFLGD